MPEIAFAYSIGFCVSLVLAIVFGLRLRKKYHSPSYLQLQSNLQKIGQRWNESEGRIEDFVEGKQAREYHKARLTAMIVCTFAVALSWFGIFALIIVWLSMEVLATNQLERKVKSSELLKKDLSASEVTQIINEIKN
jgi:hypothetical protein